MCMNEQNIFPDAPEKVNVIGVPVSAVTLETALRFAAENLDQIRGMYICAANAHTTVMARENAAYRAVQAGAVMALPDGMPLACVGRKKTDKPMKKATGTHFMQSTFTDPRFAGRKHYFYGTEPETIELVAQRLAVDYPRLQVCGYEPSVFRELSDGEVEELAGRINEAGADFLWVALGAPRQELLMHRLQGKVNCVMTGVGGAFNILAGTVKDAPMWLQNIGMEWLYRLCMEPRRLFWRYVTTNTRFIGYALRDAWKGSGNPE